MGSRGRIGHSIANGGDGSGAGSLVRLGYRAFYSLTADLDLGSNFEVTEATLIGAGVTVFQNLFMISGFLSLIAILPALLMKAEHVEEANVFI